jgi:hypothetical protein
MGDEQSLECKFLILCKRCVGSTTPADAHHGGLHVRCGECFLACSSDKGLYRGIWMSGDRSCSLLMPDTVVV